MSPNTQLITVPAPIPGAEKAAVFLLGIGEQLSAELLRQMEPEEIRQLTSAISALDSVAPEQTLMVFREFESLSGTSRFFAKGGANFARRLVEQALGAASAQKLLDPAPVRPPNVSAEVSVFQETDPQQLAAFLRNENPQTIALVLSNISAEHAGALMSALPAEVQPQVALRMSALDRISPEVFSRISEAIGTKLKALRQVSRSDGIKSLAGLLNNVPPALAEEILTKVEAENQVVGASVRNLMFTFDDILSIDKEGIKAILVKVDKKLLTTALKGTTAELRDRFTQCMSQRATEMLIEDMEALGPVRIRDVQTAQANIVNLVRDLQKDGTIARRGAGGSDEYVV